MTIKLEMDGATLTFETTEEYAAFTKLHNEVAEVEAAKEESIKVGDIITGTDDNPYGLTNERALREVVDCWASFGDDLRVKRFKHADGRTLDDSTVYNVESKYFVKTTEEEFDTKHGITKQEETDKGAHKDVPEGYEKVSFGDAEEGDYFLALEYGADIEKGEKYKLREDYDGDLEFIDDGGDERMLINRDEDDEGIVIRKIVEEETKKESFKVGDKVKIIGNTGILHHFDIGSIGTIQNVDRDGYYVVEQGYVSQFISPEDLTLVTDEEETKKEPFKIGDKVRIIGNDSVHAFDISEVVTVIGGRQEWTKGKQYHDCENEDGVRSYVRTYDAELVEEDTNKPTFKEGDIVRTKKKYTDSFGDSIKEDRLAEVRDVAYDGGFLIKQRADKVAVFVVEEDVESTLELVAKAIK